MIRTLLFDAGNTLVYVNMEEVSRTLARHGTRVSAEALWKAEYRTRTRLDDPARIASSTDLSRWKTYFEWLLEEAGIRIDARPVLEELKAYHEAHNLWEVVPPFVPPLLERLKPRYRMGVVSNANGSVVRKLTRLGLARHFDAILDSHTEGVEKPDPRIFRIALERLGARPEEALHVGDFYHVDVTGARSAGIRAVLLDPAGLHGDKDCDRIRSLEEFEQLLAQRV